MTHGEPLPARVPASAAPPSNRGNPLGDTRPWGMTSHLSRAYAPGAEKSVTTANCEAYRREGEALISRHVVDSTRRDRR
jgi:hypothetical protein